jgi:hypothetical protein
MGHHIAFWAGAIVIPLLVIGANAFARIAWGRPQSAAADVVLTLVVFDFTVIINSDEFKRFVIDVLRDGIISIFCVLLILNAVSWGIAVNRLEPRLDELYDRRRRRYKPGVAWPIVQAIAMSTVMLTLNVMPFAYRTA